eukprot:Nk52_evm44s359 gene=Nk52_evmTU44s359
MDITGDAGGGAVSVLATAAVVVIGGVFTYIVRSGWSSPKKMVRESGEENDCYYNNVSCSGVCGFDMDPAPWKKCSHGEKGERGVDATFSPSSWTDVRGEDGEVGLSIIADRDLVIPVLIIGAGPSGLAMAATLNHKGVKTLNVDVAPVAGASWNLEEKDGEEEEERGEVRPSWNRAYERLHLHTEKGMSSLPFMKIPEMAPKYVPAGMFGKYLRAYAIALNIHIHFSEMVVQTEKVNVHVSERSSSRSHKLGKNHSEVVSVWKVTTSYVGNRNYPGWETESKERKEQQHEGAEIVLHYETYFAKELIVATGDNETPRLPSADECPGLEKCGASKGLGCMYQGVVMHSSQYRNAKDSVVNKILRRRSIAGTAGSRIGGKQNDGSGNEDNVSDESEVLNCLVVGAGNTGFEIALDLCSYDNEEVVTRKRETSLCKNVKLNVALSVRSPLRIIPREKYGISIVRLSVLGGCLKFPLWLSDLLAEYIFKMPKKYDLTEFGIEKPYKSASKVAELKDNDRQSSKYLGVFTALVKGHIVPTIDIGTVDKIRDGTIKVLPGIKALGQEKKVDSKGTLVSFANGEALEFDVVIFATGFKRTFTKFLPLVSDSVATEDSSLLYEGDFIDKKGYPHHLNEHMMRHGLYFVGFHDLAGRIRQINDEVRLLGEFLDDKLSKGT